MIAERAQLSKYLSNKLGKPVEVIVPLSAAVILEGLSNGTIDLAYLSATDMLNAMNQQTASILLAGEIDGKTSYQSYWVTLKDKPYQSIADLKGKPIAFSGKTSTSGYVIPLVGPASEKPHLGFGKGGGILWRGQCVVRFRICVGGGTRAQRRRRSRRSQLLCSRQGQAFDGGAAPEAATAGRARPRADTCHRDSLRNFGCGPDGFARMRCLRWTKKIRNFAIAYLPPGSWRSMPAAHLGSLKESIALAKRGSE